MCRLNQDLQSKFAWIDAWSEAIFAGILTALIALAFVAIYILGSTYWSIIHIPGS
jgi:hypothetical protein